MINRIFQFCHECHVYSLNECFNESEDRLKSQVKDVTYFNTKVAPVDIIAEEQIASVGWWTTHLEQLHEIVELSVNVTTDRDRCFDVDHRLLEPE